MKPINAFESNDGTLHKTGAGADRWERTCSINSVRHKLKNAIVQLKTQKTIMKDIIFYQDGQTGHGHQQSVLSVHHKECRRLDMLLKTVKDEYRALKS